MPLSALEEYLTSFHLTGPQLAMLREVRDEGPKVYNGRARRTIKAIEATGLVTVDWDLAITTTGSLWRITVTWKGEC